jgi:hypothetical protein
MADEKPVPPLDPVIEAFKAGIDRTLLVSNLRLTVDERLRKLEDFHRSADALRKAGARARKSTAP